MKTRPLTLLVAVGAALLLVLVIGAATAFAEGGILGAGPETTAPTTESAVPSTETVVPSTDTDVPSADTTASTTEATVPSTETTASTAEITLPSTDAITLETPSSSTTTTNWGHYISGLRHAGDHTPAAVLKGKTVPGWQKHHPTTTTTTTSTP